MDPKLWKIENYLDFVRERRKLLSAEANKRFAELLHGDERWLAGPSAPIFAAASMEGGIDSEKQEEELQDINRWMESHGLPQGTIGFDYADLNTGEQRAIFDLAWPNGIQEGLTSPVAVLLGDNSDALTLASNAGFVCFTSGEDLRKYVTNKILALAAA